MKKTFLSIIAILCVTISASAQSQKETVIVDDFVYSAQWNTAHETTQALRGVVLQAFIEKGRFNVVDAEQNAALRKLNETRMANTEENVDASNVLDSESTEVYKSLGAKYLVQGDVTIINANRGKDALSDKYVYKGEVTLSLTVHNIVDGSIAATESIVLTGSDDNSKDLAISSAVRMGDDDIMDFVDEHFPFTTYIEQIEKQNKKGDAKELYIAGGTELGVEKGQTFVVKMIKKIGSRTTQVEIGKLEAKEIMDGITLCIVTKGGKEISEEYKKTGDFSNIVVVSDKISFFGGLGRIFK